MGKLIKGENDLLTWCRQNGDRGKQLIFEWCGIDKNGNGISIDNIARGSHKKVQWKCVHGHTWIADVIHRTAVNEDCPFCYERDRASIVAKGRTHIGKNDLLTWCNNNGEYGKQIIEEWTGLDECGKHIDIGSIACASSSKVMWKCKQGHIWAATIHHRTSKYRTKCPKCSCTGTSYPEQFLYSALKQIYPRTENRCKVLKQVYPPAGIEFDIVVPEIPMCIEYSGAYWHDGLEERSKLKRDICNKCGIKYIEVVEESSYKGIYKIEGNQLRFNQTTYFKDEMLQFLLAQILEPLGKDISNIDFELVRKHALKFSYKRAIPYEQSLQSLFPNLALEWHPTRNTETPLDIKPSSNKTVYWLCPICGRGFDGSWTASVHDRIRRKSGCRGCKHNWSKQ